MIRRLRNVAFMLAILFGSTCMYAAASETAKTIKVSARRFEYVPQEIRLKRDVPVIFQITSEDRSHGFNIPSMKLRVDVVPGKVAELKWTPKQAGEFDFFCDVFCGSGHEGMNGKIIVE